MRHSNTRALTAAAACFVLSLSAMPALAQTGPGGQAEASKLPRPQQPGLGEVLKSGLEWLVGEIQGRQGSRKDRERWDGHGSPRATMLTFLSAMEDIEAGRDGWSRAAKALGQPPDQTATRDKARALFDALSRFGAIKPYELPGRASVERHNISRFRFFPQGTKHAWIWRALDEPPAGEIVLQEKSDGHWTFSPETLDKIEELRNSLLAIPPYRDGSLPGDVFLQAFRPLSEVTAVGWIGFAASALIGAGMAFGAARLLKAWAGVMGRRGHDVLRELVGGLSKPVALAMVAMSIAFALNFLELSSALEDVGWALVQFMFILAAMWLIFTLVDLVSCVTRKVAGTFGTAYDEMAAILMRRTLRTATFIFVVIFLLQNILGIRVTALLAGVGLAGLALSLAGHGFFRNAFGALSIFVNKPFLVGDWIHFEEEYGVVEDVGLYATKIRWLHGELATVPNMRFIDERVDNLSERKFLRRAMNIAVRYDMKAADMRKAVGIVRDVLHDEELADEGKYGPDKRVPHVTFSHYGPDHLNIRAYYWYYIGDDGEALQRNSDRGWYSFLEHCEQVNTKLKAAFDEAGIDFAFPTETHRVESVDDRPAELTVKANRAGSQETK